MLSRSGFSGKSGRYGNGKEAVLPDAVARP
jgi:hypothetical protein